MFGRKATKFMNWGFFLRALLPAWVFFVDVTPEIRLSARDGDNSEDSWKTVLPPLRRSVKNLFWNPHNNYLHACHNSLHHLLTDINELENTSPDSVEALPSYQVVKNMVAFELKTQNPQMRRYQFQISVHPLSDPNGIGEDFMKSPIYEISHDHA